MNKHKIGKRIISLCLAIVMIVGMVTVSGMRKVEAANSDISISWNGYWDAFVYDAQIDKSDSIKQYCFDSIVVDGVEVKGTVLADLTTNAQFAIWDNYWIGASKPAASVLIKAGTKLQEFDTAAWAVKEGGQTYIVKDNMYVVYKDDAWTVDTYQEPTTNPDPTPTPDPEPTPSARETIASISSRSGETQLWLNTEPALYTYYGDWSVASSTVLVDSVETVMNWNITQLGIYIDLPAEYTTIRIPANTEFAIVHNAAGNGDVTPFKITNEITYQKPTANPDPTPTPDPEPTPSARETIASISSSSGETQLWLNTEPALYTYYGDWSVASSTVLVDSVETVMNWNITQLGIYIDLPAEYTTIRIPVNTEFAIVHNAAGNGDVTPFKITNEIVWPMKSEEIDLGKYNFNDVQVEVLSVTGSALTMEATLTKSKTTKLSDIYGDWSVTTGKVFVGEPGVGIQEITAVYSVASNYLIIYGINPGLKDSIKIEKGTILWPDSACKSQDPIRIVNDVILTRNAEDEWNIQTGNYVVDKGQIQEETIPVESEKNDKAEQTITVSTDRKETKVRLVDNDSKESMSTDDRSVSKSVNPVIYVGIGATSLLLIVLVVWCIVMAKKRKNKETN